MATEGAMPRNRMVADGNYSICTQDWFCGAFARALRTLLFQMQSTVWRSESNDCDDFTRIGATFAQMLHNRGGKHPDTSLAVGEFWYVSTEGPHAILAAIVKKDGYKLFFLDPQDQRPKLLTYDEIASCSAYRF